MRILDRYILLEFIRNFFLSLVALVFLFFIADYLRGVWDADASSLVLFKYATYQIPHFFCQMMPPAAMLGTMVTLSLLNRRNELTAIHASGISVVHVSFLIFGAIFISCCLSLMTYDRIVPPFARQRLVYYWKEIKGRKDFTLDIKTTKIWYRSKNHIYNLRLFDKSTNTIRGIGVYFFDSDFRLDQHIEAENAKFVDQKWQLQNGLATSFPVSESFPIAKRFKEKTLLLQETPKDFLEIEKQVDGLRLKDLSKFIERNKEAGIDTKAFEVDFHSRLAVSFLPLVMGLLAIPYSVRQKRQGGLAKDIAICVTWIFGYWLTFSITLSLGNSGAVVPWLAVWGPSAIILAIAVYLILRLR